MGSAKTKKVYRSKARLSYAGIVTAFDQHTVGTKVKEYAEGAFRYATYDAIRKHDWSQEPQAVLRIDVGHHFNLRPFVTCGVGRHTNRVEDYVIREYRGKVKCFLKRDLAPHPKRIDVVVYTKDAYLEDPDVLGDPKELARIQDEDPTHVLVAVLAAPEKDWTSPLSPGRLLANLAGGNNEAFNWNADTIREKAEESLEYYNEWCTVAD